MESIGFPPKCMRRLECMQKFFKAWSRAFVVGLESGFVWKQPIFCRKAVWGWAENAGCQLLCFFTTSQSNWLIFFYCQDFQDSENEHYVLPVPSLHWSISHLCLYFRMEIKSEITETLFHFQPSFWYEVYIWETSRYGSLILSSEWVNSGHLKYLAPRKITQGCIGQSLLRLHDLIFLIWCFKTEFKSMVGPFCWRRDVVTNHHSLTI